MQPLCGQLRDVLMQSGRGSHGLVFATVGYSSLPWLVRPLYAFAQSPKNAFPILSNKTSARLSNDSRGEQPAERIAYATRWCRDVRVGIRSAR